MLGTDSNNTYVGTTTPFPVYLIAGGEANKLITLMPGGNVGIKDTAPQNLLSVNNNAAAGINIGGAVAQFLGTDGINNVVYNGAWAAIPQIVLSRAEGTGAAPTATATGQVLGQISAGGHNGSAYTAGNRARILILATGVGANWTPTDNGNEIAFETMANGTTSRQEGLRITNNYMVKFSNAASWHANGATAASLGSTSPGAATPQTWMMVVDSGGVTRYIPCF